MGRVIVEVQDVIVEVTMTVSEWNRKIQGWSAELTGSTFRADFYNVDEVDYLDADVGIAGRTCRQWRGCQECGRETNSQDGVTGSACCISGWNETGS